MRRARAGILGLALLAAVPGASRAAIYEYADAEGTVRYYKYTDARGREAFTNELASIPQEIRNRQKVVRRTISAPRKDPAPKPAPEGPAPAGPGPAAPSAETAPAAPLYKVEVSPPAPAPGVESGTDPLVYLALLAGAGLLAALAVFGKRALDARSRPPAPRRTEERGGAGTTPDGPAARERRGEERRVRDGAGAPTEARPAAERPQEILDRHLKAGDFLAAAPLCESLGDLEKAAACYRDGGREDRALELFLKARNHREAAPLLEKSGELLRAAESYLASGNAEKAAECFARGGEPARGEAALASFLYESGRVTEAAAHAEAAGDLVRAAELSQEAGEFARAGALYSRAGFHDEAAESYLLANDQAGAAGALERAGRHLEAAKALQAAGGDPGRVAELFEKGGDGYAAGRLYSRAGELDRALNALQGVDPASEHARSAALLIGMIFLKKGMTKLAAEKFVKLIDNQPVGKGNLDPWYFLALCHEAAGDRAKARAIFEKILVEDYAFRDVRQRLGKSAPG